LGGKRVLWLSGYPALHATERKDPGAGTRGFKLNVAGTMIVTDDRKHHS
jgi:hypothetical protein